MRSTVMTINQPQRCAVWAMRNVLIHSVSVMERDFKHEGFKPYNIRSYGIKFQSVSFSTCRIILLTFRYGWMGNISRPQGFDSPNVQPVCSLYTDWAIPARLYPVPLHNGHIPFSQSFHKQYSTNSVVLKMESARSSEASEPIFTKGNVRTRCDLDPCCAFGSH